MSTLLRGFLCSVSSLVEFTGMSKRRLNRVDSNEAFSCIAINETGLSRTGRLVHDSLTTSIALRLNGSAHRARLGLGIVGLILAALIVLQPIHAQVSGTGTIQGIVSDSSGGVIQGATVTAINPSTGRSTSANTTSSGLYVLTALPPGEYTVKFKAEGFQPVTQEHISVHPISIVGLNLTMEAGSTIEILVTTAPPALNTENGMLDNVLPSETYAALPVAMNGGPKSPLGFTALLPGTSISFQGNANINGGAQGTSAVYLNGLPIISPELQGDINNITGSTTTEVVSEFQVITSGIPAFYTGQGVSNLVSKSGTNEFHGDVYENVRNTALDWAPSFPADSPVPVEHQHEYGVSVGGPIMKNRLFFFGNFDHYKNFNGNNPTSYHLPTAAERVGDFSALPVPIYDPATTVCSNGNCTRTAFPGNIIPRSRISAVSSSLASYLPSTMNGDLQRNYYGAFTGGTVRNTYMAKIDYTVNDKHHAYVLLQNGKQSQNGLINIGYPQLPLPYAGAQNNGQDIWTSQVGETWAIRSNLVNVFGAQFNRFDTPADPFTRSGNYPAKAGLTGLPTGDPQHIFPEVDFNGPNSPTTWAQNTIGYSDVANMFTYQDNLQWTKGKHSVTVGGAITRQQHNFAQPNYAGFAFSNNETAGFDSNGGLITTTGNAYASYLLGQVDTLLGLDQSVIETGGRYSQYAFYAQDNWKLMPRFTLNLGLRYTLALPYTEARNKASWLNPTLSNSAVNGYHGALQFAGNGTASCNCSTRVQTHYLGFDPRIGAAYSLDAKTSIRGSFTINHFLGAALGGSDVIQGTDLQGYSAVLNFTTPDAGVTPAFNWNSGLPVYQHPPFLDPTFGTGFNTTTGPQASSITYDRPDTAGISPYTENWNLTIDRALTPSVIWEITYTGNQTHHISQNGGLGIYSNQILPQYLKLGDLLRADATPENIAAAQAVFPSITLPYANFVGSIGQMLRPFPQYNGINDNYANAASANYHALQTSVQKRMSNGLYLLGSYVWSKSMNTNGATIRWLNGGARSAYNLPVERSVAMEDFPHAIKIAWVYTLPFGRGHNFGRESALLNTLVGGWQISGDNFYVSGAPLGQISGTCNVPYTGGCYADYSPNFQGSARINGKYGSGDPSKTSYINSAAFQNAAPYTFGNTPRTLAYSLRNPWTLNEDATLGKDFSFDQRIKVRIQVDAFNLFNRTVFGGISTDVSNPDSFGTVGNQANRPRQLQLEAYISF